MRSKCCSFSVKNGFFCTLLSYQNRKFCLFLCKIAKDQPLSTLSFPTMTNVVDDGIISLFCRGRVISVPSFLHVVREMTPDDQLDNVEAIALSFLSRAAAVNRFDTITFHHWGANLNDEVDVRIFDVLVSIPCIRQLSIFPPVDADSLPSLLGRALPKMANTTQITWTATEMSALEANQIFAVIQQGIPTQRLNLVLNLDNYCDSVVSA